MALLQEVICEHVESKVVDYIVDRIDNEQYDPIAKIEKFAVETADGKDRDFVKDIIEKERKFNQTMGIKDKIGVDMPTLDESVVGVRVSPKLDASDADKSNRSSRSSAHKQVRDSIDVSIMQYDKEKTPKPSNTIEDSRLQNKPEAFFVDSKKPKRPMRETKSKMQIEKDQDLRHRLKKDQASLIMSLDASQYSEYKGKNNGFELNEPKKKLNAEEMMENAFNHYMSDREQYDGKFNPIDEDERQNYDEYKKIYDVPKDAEVFEKYRKKAELEKIKENQEKIWKKPDPEVDEPVPCIAFDHLRPLEDPEEFIKQFANEIEGITYIIQNAKAILLKSRY